MKQSVSKNEIDFRSDYICSSNQSIFNLGIKMLQLYWWWEGTYWCFLHIYKHLRNTKKILEKSRLCRKLCYRVSHSELWSKWLWGVEARTTDTQWRHKSKKSENLGRCGRQNMLRPYLKIWDWELIFGHAVKTISSPGVLSPWFYVVNWKMP